MSTRAEAAAVRGRGIVGGWSGGRPDRALLLAGFSFLVLLALALFGGRLAPHEPTYFVVEHAADPRPYDPGIVYPFGSDVLGRDLFSLVLAGARSTLAIVLIAERWVGHVDLTGLRYATRRPQLAASRLASDSNCVTR